MSVRTVLFTPVDAWFFRDGRPYYQGEAGQTDVRSIFPPSALTVIGAVRAALARGQGWNGRGSWNADLQRDLGNGTGDLGSLRFHGPFLMHKERYLFPVPLHLRGHWDNDADSQKKKWSHATFLAPSETEMESDLGSVKFPVPQSQIQPDRQLKEPTGLWVTTEGYNSILRGDDPDADAFVRSDDLWRIEPRVGLERDHEKHAAKEGMLYSPAYVRLRRDVKLVVTVEGIQDDWKLPDLIPFGGESRLAHCEVNPGSLPLPDVPVDQIRKSETFTVSLLSPLLLPTNESGRHSHPEPGNALDGLGSSRIVSACVGKPIRIGGWNSVHREPEPLLSYLPAGSTWFCEIARPDALDSLLKMHGKTIGDRRPHGLGQIAIGAWPTNLGDTA